MSNSVVIAWVLFATEVVANLVVASWRPRDGYEDDLGFHFTSESAPVSVE